MEINISESTVEDLFARRKELAPIVKWSPWDVSGTPTEYLKDAREESRAIFDELEKRGAIKWNGKVWANVSGIEGTI